jgi:GxxExxY protein
MKDPIMDLCDIVRETSYSVHRYLRNGHLEKVYENCLVHRLVKKKVTLRQQYPIDIYDEDGTAIGHFVVDLFVEDRLLVEFEGVFNSSTRTHGAGSRIFARVPAAPCDVNKLRRSNTSNQETYLVTLVPLCGLKLFDTLEYHRRRGIIIQRNRLRFAIEDHLAR